jgi:hypothetical protein
VKGRLLAPARGALAAIEASRGRIDDLNVYPVPDGDTGTNLTLTVRAVVEALEASTAPDRVTLAHELARAALMGARGNSGVILSQIVRGAADSLGVSDDLALALRGASDAAYRAVKKPVEGTMLTAIRELAEEAERGSDLQAVIARGADCVVRTQQMLPALTEAGVVDAGAAGLVEILRGIASGVTGAPLPEPAHDADPVQSFEAIHQERSRFTYCTGFVVEGVALDADALEGALDPLGDSMLVVGDETALKIHIHTDDPGRALSIGVAHGSIANIEIANMRVQALERERRLLHAVPDAAEGDGATAHPYGVVAVVTGEGNTRLFESLGVRVVDGGRTMNPSTSELLAAIEASGAREVIVLPNNRNVILAAEQAAAAATRSVSVVPTETIQAGLAAAVAFDPDAAREANLDGMTRAAADVGAGAVTIASRDVQSNGLSIRKGAWLGLADGNPIAGGESFDEVARSVVERLLQRPRGILTLLIGADPQPLDGLLANLADSHPELEVEVHDGGQTSYTLLVGAE